MATQPSQNQQKSKAKKLEITDGQRQLLLSAEIDDLDDSSLTDVKDDSVIAVGPRLDTTSTTVSLCVQKRRDIMGMKFCSCNRI